ncbi:ABC transporter substrate-binding protein [Motilibacter peucedani]|uniref:ABC transporter substrate-binding protein n=1 Tax=Motilibacter peucedani TaxID=598650 RepID=UPI001600D186|nr:extracellular solute-binding protein [Motilibacter peucedani]
MRVLGMWSGPELQSFQAVQSVWERQTGATVDWQGSDDVAADLQRSSARSGPDIAVLPNLRVLQELADAGRLVPLDRALDVTQLRHDYPAIWLALGSRAGKHYGLFYKVTDKSTVWYAPTSFTANGWSVPSTWHDLLSLADRMVAAGHTPFSVVSASGQASGWPLTDWVSEIVLTGCGPDVYDRWVSARLPWTDPCVRKSFVMLLDLLHHDGYVLGGADAVLSTSDEQGADPLYARPPKAEMYYMASFAQGFITSRLPDLRPGRDYGFFPFPAVNPEWRGSITVGADVVVMTRDTPAARAFLSYLAGAPAQEVWIRRGGFTSVARSVPTDTYPDPVAREVATHLSTARATRFSAGDMMPATLQRAWWRGMLRLVRDPGALDSVLGSLTRLARSAR